MVSLPRVIPLKMIKADTARPIKPSICRPVNRSMRAATNTAEVEITSLRLSAAVASSAPESICLPRVLLNKDSHSFTAIEPASTMTSGRENATGEGAMIFMREDLPSSTPMTRISAATARPDRYSNLAWP